MPNYIRKITETHTRLQIVKSSDVKYAHRDVKSKNSHTIDVGEPVLVVVEEFRELTSTEEMLFSSRICRDPGDGDEGGGF
jgi:hypothetical protein